MLNMSSRFYKYISTLLLSYFNETGILPGERFSLQLDKETEVQSLVDAIMTNDSHPVEEFKYKLNSKKDYKTFSIQFAEARLLFAYTSSQVKPDFLVTLRNLVGEQKGEFVNTALISIVSEQLDSIQGGSSDLQKEGMPLHPVMININLQKSIRTSNLSDVDQLILTEALEKLMEYRQFEEINFFDFESIFTILEKGSIDDEDYRNFGLFKDAELATYPENSRSERLAKNLELFEHVQRVQNYGLNSDELENKFSPSGSKVLIKEGWMDTDFSDVLKYHLDFEKMNKRQKVELTSIKIAGGFKYWRRVQHEKTAAGRRKHHVIVFNDGREEIEVQATFAFQGDIKSLSRDFLKHYGEECSHIDVKNTNIFIKIRPEGDEAPRVRVVYKHHGRAALGAEINIIVVPFEETFLGLFRSRYLVNQKQGIELQFEEDELAFDDKIFVKSVELKASNQKVSINRNNSLILKPLPDCFDEEHKITVNLDYEGIQVPLVLKNELPESMPIDARRIWKLVRESSEDMQWVTESNRLILGNREYYFHSQYKEYFEWEKDWLSKEFMSAEYSSGQLFRVDIDISEELKDKYKKFIKYFSQHSFENAIPSLCTVTKDYSSYATDYIRQYCREVEKFPARKTAGRRGVDLFKLGIIKSNNQIFLTPFHPLMVAYKLKLYELLKTEVVDGSILNRINPEALIPFLYDEQNTVYKPEPQHDALDWIVLKPVQDISISDSNNYLAQVVADKMTQFKEHFSYLFINNSKAPFLVNVINISNDKEILRGIIQWVISEARKNGINNINPIELTLYQSENHESAFDLFSSIETVTEVEEVFDIKLNQIRGIEKQDLLNCIRDNLLFYKQSEGDEFRYAHISFYNMHAHETHSIQPMLSIDTGISIEGLNASIPSMRDGESYVSGFGLKSYSNFRENDLISVAYYFNELALNSQNEGNNSYRKGEAVFSRISASDEDLMKKVLRSSNWVTFIDPHIDLDFFNDYSNELLIIHYSDQYSSSNKYDAITVTDKSSQYFSVIAGFLGRKGIDVSSNSIDFAIKSFNSFNGEWLLRVIGSKGHYDREKLSILSAIKYSLSYFDHPNILWVPISMEEVLRIAGVVGLNKSDGVFTAKNLGIHGSQSDDLLLIGLEELYGNISLHFYPVEVKIGNNSNQTINKGINQVLTTKSNIISQLTGENGQKFSGKFYRNFFVHLFLVNARKMNQNKVWEEKNYKLDEEIIQKLLQDQYVIDDSLQEYIGAGAIVSFQKGAFHRSAELINGVLLLRLIEEDGYEGLIKSSKEINKWLHGGSSDFIMEDMIAYSYKVDEFVAATSEDDTLSTGILNENENLNEDNLEYDYSQHMMDTSPITVIEHNVKEDYIPSTNNTDTKASNVLNTRIKIGTAINSKKDIFWEYGNESLPNRHLLISGKSGQGKTYFMQCLLLEKSKFGIPSIVIDYTEGFLPNQLEPEFLQALGDKLVQKIVYSEKLPMNPFQKNIRDIGGIQLEESSTDVAERIRGVFASVYKSLGIQQLNSIYEAILRGSQLYGEGMDLVRLRELLERDDSTYARTALSQIRPLIDRNPFNKDSQLNWNGMLESDGNVYIIQLTGFPREVQLMITEFILWDLWNYSVKYGQKDHPIPVIMDEAQNLDHTESSPSARILTEGRKFGWSAWYATQFLRSQLDADELARLQNSSQKIYFAPPEQELSNIASTFTKDNQEKKYWEGKLASLKKGQCIVHGPSLLPTGELSSPSVVVVDITSLNKRM